MDFPNQWVADFLQNYGIIWDANRSTICFLSDSRCSPHTNREVIFMAKQGMKRPEFEHRKNTFSPVPIIGGKAKSGNEKANPLIAGANGKVYHDSPHGDDAFPGIDNDLAVENLTDGFDMTAADLQDLQ